MGVPPRTTLCTAKAKADELFPAEARKHFQGLAESGRVPDNNGSRLVNGTVCRCQRAPGREIDM